MRKAITLFLVLCPLLALADKSPKRDAWVWMKTANESHMGGSIADLKSAQSLQKADEELLWVRRGGKVWVVRDRAVLSRLGAIFVRVNKLGEEMDALGHQMDALGELMEPLGQRMEELGRKLERAITSRQEEALSAKMEKLGKDMEELGKRMEPLGQRMDKLGDQMDRESAAAEAKLADLVNEAIKTGKAVEIR